MIKYDHPPRPVILPVSRTARRLAMAGNFKAAVSSVFNSVGAAPPVAIGWDNDHFPVAVFMVNAELYRLPLSAQYWGDDMHRLAQTIIAAVQRY